VPWFKIRIGTTNIPQKEGDRTGNRLEGNSRMSKDWHSQNYSLMSTVSKSRATLARLQLDEDRGAL